MKQPKLPPPPPAGPNDWKATARAMYPHLTEAGRRDARRHWLRLGFDPEAPPVPTP